MSEPEDLNAQIAQRLFGWEPNLYGVWGKPIGENRYAIEAHLPAYTTDPAATAQVWQWVERSMGDTVESITFEYYHAAGTMVCLITCTQQQDPLQGPGATWPEALCRAALALAAALDGEG